MDNFSDVPGAGSERKLLSSINLVLVGAAFLWLANRALVYRRLPTGPLFAVIGAGLLLVAWQGSVLPVFMTRPWWLFPSFVAASLIYCAFATRTWFPATHGRNEDEVGIKKSIADGFRKKNQWMVAGWIIVIVAIAVSVMLTTGEKAIP